MLAILVALLTPAWADCPAGSVSSQQVTTHMQDAVLAYATLDEDGFYASANAAAEGLPCIGDVFLPPNAAAFHRLIGIRAMYEGEQDLARLSFQAATALEPDYVLSARIAPEGGKLDRAYQEAKGRAASLQVAFSVPDGLDGFVDGTASAERPANVPAIVQVADGGVVKWTGYVSAGERLPDELLGVGRDPVAEPEPVVEPAMVEPEPRVVEPEPVAVTPPPPTPEPLPTGPPPSASGGSASGMWTGAAITGLLTAALAGGSIYSRTRFDNDPTALNYHATNGGYYGAIGMGVLTVGLIGGAASMGAE